MTLNQPGHLGCHQNGGLKTDPASTFTGSWLAMPMQSAAPGLNPGLTLLLSLWTV